MLMSRRLPKQVCYREMRRQRAVTILLGPDWDIDREAVISQQSRRLELLDKGWNTDKPGGRVVCRLEEVVAVEVDHVSARVVVGSILRDPPAGL